MPQYIEAANEGVLAIITIEQPEAVRNIDELRRGCLNILMEFHMDRFVPDSVQRFVISHLNESDFKIGGLRSYSAYRDLGVAMATNGLAHAHVIRMIAPFSPELSVRHHHDVQFQLVYCLKGWFQTDFEGIGPQRLVAGSCWVQPPGIRHTVVGWSDDCELLEIIVPAEHETINDP